LILFQPDIPPHVAQIIRGLPPDIKKSVREAIRALAKDHALGEPLGGRLTGLWKYRVRRYRIIYLPRPVKRSFLVYAVGHRREIYDKIAPPTLQDE